MIKKDQLIGAGLVLVGVVFAVLTAQFSMPLSRAYPGPKMMPAIAIFGLIVCGGGIFIQSTLKNDEEKVFLAKQGWIRVGMIFAVLILYVLGLKYLGYLICTPFLLYTIATLFAKGQETKVVSRIIFSVLFTVFVYLIYVQVFGLSLPNGILF